MKTLRPALLSLVVASTTIASPAGPSWSRRSVDGGVALDLSLSRTDGRDAPFREGDDVGVTLRVADGTTGTPLAGVRPSVWMSRRTGQPAVDGKPCAAKIASFSSGSILAAAEVDLNVYHVLALNADPTLTVVNPRFGFGGSHLLAVVELSAPGEDWALSGDQARLFVSLPRAHRVAVVDTTSWRVLREVEAGPSPTDLQLQPDGKYLWVATEAGVSALEASTLEVSARIGTGRGPHRLAVSGDSRFVLVANAGEGTVSVIDAGTLARRADVPAGARPVSISWSGRSEMAYVASEADGVLTVVEPRQAKAIARLAGEPGTSQVAVSRDGRWAFVLNARVGHVEVIDTSTSRVVQSATLANGPEQVNFTDTLAYITQLRSDQVLVATLASVGESTQPLGLADFPGGENPFGRVPRSGLAAGIAAVPGESAVVVANAGDGEIYYYKEGMAAPMGRFSNYGHRPLAVMAYDRSLREGRPGTFQSQARLSRGGHYDVAVYLDSPRAVSCFELEVAADEGRERDRIFGRIAVAYAERPERLPVARPTALRFRLLDVRAGRDLGGVPDVRALLVQVPGHWRASPPVEARPDGAYELTVTPPAAGIYYLYVGSQQLELRLTNPQYVAFDAR